MVAIKLTGILPNNEDLVIVSYYSPPKEDLVKQALDDIFKLGPRVLLLGDLNAHSPVWNSNPSKTYNKSGHTLTEFLEAEDLVILNDMQSPTFEPPNDPNYKAIIDLAICPENLVSCFNSFSICDDRVIDSDHSPVLVQMFTNKPPSFGLITRQINKIDWDKFRENVERLSCQLAGSEIRTSAQLGSAISKLTELISEALSLATETRTIQYDPSRRMRLPKFILKLIQEKRQYFREFRRTGMQEFKTLYNKMIIIVREEIRKYKQAEWEKFCNELNTHQVGDSVIWRILKAVENCGDPKPNKLPSLRVNGSLLSDPKAVSDVFAENLEEVFQDANDPNFTNEFKTEVENSIPNLFKSNEEKIDKISDYEVSAEIKRLRAKGAPGEDKITNKCLKNLPESFIPFISRIFNASLKLSFIPLIWKKAIVTMIPKPLKDHKNVSNFRPISLLDTLPKLLERLILNRLNLWMVLSKINNPDLTPPISTYQCGFRKGRQTKDHIFRIIQDGLAAFNRGEKMGAIFVDIMKAFDRVWHNGLLYKLDKLKIPNYLGKWIADYLTNRSFQVRIGNSLSADKPIKAGVPQGSVLGPVLFNLYFNDIMDKITNKVNIGVFADDFSAWTCDTNLTRINIRLQAELDIIQAWMNKWRTSLSIEKTVWTVFSKGNRCGEDALELTYNNKVIKLDRNPKFLGVTLDIGLRFHKYAQILKERCSRRLNMLRRIRGQDWGASSKLLLTSYKVLIRPIIDYVPFVTLLMANKNYMILERVQRRAARAITYWPMYTSTAKIYERLSLVDIRTRALMLTNKYMIRSMRMNELIRDSVNTYNTCPAINEGLSKHGSRATILGTLRDFDLDCDQLLFPMN
jgi:hypothetical protein